MANDTIDTRKLRFEIRESGDCSIITTVGGFEEIERYKELIA